MLIAKGYVVIPEAMPRKMRAEHVASVKQYTPSDLDNKARSVHADVSGPTYRETNRHTGRQTHTDSHTDK